MLLLFTTGCVCLFNFALTCSIRFGF